MRHRRTTSVVRPNRRKPIWATSLVASTALNPGVNITPIDILAGLRTAGVGVVGGTLVRTHVWLSLNSADSDASPSYMWGIVVWDKSTFTTTSPNVQTDFYADWLMQREISPGTSPCSTGAPINAPTAWLYGNEYDIKSRRRLHEMNDTPLMCLGNQGSVAGAYSIFIKALVLLP